MDAQRAEARARIDQLLRKRDSEYPLWRALTDVGDYFLAGSPVKALEAMSSRAEQQLQQARRAAADVVR